MDTSTFNLLTAVAQQLTNETRSVLNSESDS